MGKGSRARQFHDEERLNKESAVKATKKKKSGNGKLSAILLLIATVAIVGILVFSTISSSGIFIRTTTAVKSDNYKLNGAVMQYFMKSVAYNYVNEIYSTYSSYLSALGSDYTIYDLLGIDTTKSLKKQYNSSEKTQTWFDYFAEMAELNVTQTLVYAEAAIKNNVTLDDEDIAEIDSSMKSLESAAAYYSMTLDTYIANQYGNGVKAKDIRLVYEMSTLANKYAEKLNDDYTADADKNVDTINAYYEKNKNNYLTADYVSYKLTATKGTIATDATEETKTTIENKYTADKEANNALAEKLLAAKSAEEFKKVIEDNFIETNRQSYMDSKYQTYLATAEGETDDAKEAAAKAKVEEDLKTDAASKTASIETTDYTYTADTDLSKFIFGEGETAAAAVNAATKIVDDSKDADGTYTVSVYFVTRAAARSEQNTYDITYMVLQEGTTDTTYTQANAEAAKLAFSTLDKTKEGFFKTFADTYENKTNFSSLESLTEANASEMKELQEWLFGTDHVAGDYDLIKCAVTEDSVTTNYYVLVYVDAVAEQEWYLDVRTDLVSEKIDEWYEAAEKATEITFNKNAYKKIDLTLS